MTNQRGPGQPPKYDGRPAVKVSYTLDPQVVEHINAEASERREKRSTLVNRILSRWAKRLQRQPPPQS